jgi:tRNA threonylcarbamoyladenosine biosynthesis protein TsaE
MRKNEPMISEQKAELLSESPEETLDLGERIGRMLSDGIVIRLIGDLGSGKTLLVKGIARGLDVPSQYLITSPTFTLVNEYKGRQPLYHADLYRLSTAVDFEDIGLLDILCEDAVVVIEWAEKLTEDIENTWTIHFATIDDQKRQIVIKAQGDNAIELLKKLEK